MSEALQILGFQLAWVEDKITLPSNGTALEKAIQLRWHKHLRLGHRLWRVAGAGSSKFKTSDTRLSKVFIAVSFKVQAMIRSGRVIVVE